ncbi:MAG: UPF0236 family protein [Trichococcus flocculiformis]
MKSAKDAWEKAAIYLGSHYDLKNTVVISNTDGGSGYRAEDCALAIGVCKEHIHQIDRYHVHRKVKSRLSWCPEMELPLKKALWSYEWDSIAIVLDTIESKISLEQEKGSEGGTAPFGGLPGKKLGVSTSVTRYRSLQGPPWELGAVKAIIDLTATE